MTYLLLGDLWAVLAVSEDPPRPSDGSLLNQEMSGYMPARGDFTVEYDNHAEHDLKDMDFPEDDDQVIRGMHVFPPNVIFQGLTKSF